MGFDYRNQKERDRDDRLDAYKDAASAAEAVPWDPNMKFQPALKIQASTYRQPSLFDVPVCEASEKNPNRVWDRNPEKFAVSPCGKWGYRERILPADQPLETKVGNRTGIVTFDGDVKIPMLNYRYDGGQIWHQDPIMSFTPMEFFSLRVGVKRARGHVVVAGLGMGWQLQRVCKKRTVQRVTLVEKYQGIVDWIMPRLDLNGRDVEVLVGDACDIVPTLTADVALIDIFTSYGGNRGSWARGVHQRRRRAQREGIELQRGKIGDMWFWGA